MAVNPNTCSPFTEWATNLPRKFQDMKSLGHETIQSFFLLGVQRGGGFILIFKVFNILAEFDSRPHRHRHQH